MTAVAPHLFGTKIASASQLPTLDTNSTGLPINGEQTATAAKRNVNVAIAVQPQFEQIF